MYKIPITEIGDSLGVVLPDEVLTRLRATPGDTLLMSETPSGYVLTTAMAPSHQDQMEAAKAVKRDRRETLRKLEE